MTPDKEKTHIEIPSDVEFILDRLGAQGFSAYAVGGAVRDTLMGRIPTDWDITTSARPHAIKAIFRRTVDTGIKHGTVTVLIKDARYEVTTYRVDGAYSDSRHPDSVTFSDSLAEDLRRRDFTVNAIAYSPASGLVDPYCGRDDISHRIIRAVGEPEERFHEDALRMLRAVRFSAQLEFTIEEKTKEAIKNNAASLKNVSRERIADELIKLITSDHIEKVRDLFELGIAPYISEYFEKVDTGHLSIQNVPCPAAKHMRLAFLLEGLSDDEVRSLMRGLKLDNITIRKTRYLVSRFPLALPTDRYELKKLMSGTSPELFSDLLTLKEVSGREDLGAVKALYRDIIARDEPIYLNELAIGGSDLMELGIKEGPVIGRTLERLLDKVQRDPSLNTKEELLKEAKSISN